MWELTQRELEADGPVSDLPVNHCGLEYRPEQQEALSVVCVQLDTDTSIDMFSLVYTCLL